MSTWADKHKTALTCCQFNDSVNSISVEKTDLVCETKNNFVKIPCNNSKNSSLQDEMNNRTLSSKQSMIDLEFENLTYSVSTWSWSIKKFPKGKFFIILMIMTTERIHFILLSLLL